MRSGSGRTRASTSGARSERFVAFRHDPSAALQPQRRLDHRRLLATGAACCGSARRPRASTAGIPSSGVFTSYTRPALGLDAEQPRRHLVRAGADGALWIGTFGGGLDRLDRRRGRYTVCAPTAAGLARRRPRDVAADRSPRHALGRHVLRGPAPPRARREPLRALPARCRRPGQPLGERRDVPARGARRDAVGGHLRRRAEPLRRGRAALRPLHATTPRGPTACRPTSSPRSPRTPTGRSGSPRAAAASTRSTRAAAGRGTTATTTGSGQPGGRHDVRAPIDALRDALGRHRRRRARSLGPREAQAGRAVFRHYTEPTACRTTSSTPCCTTVAASCGPARTAACSASRPGTARCAPTTRATACPATSSTTARPAARRARCSSGARPASCRSCPTCCAGTSTCRRSC